MSVLRAILSALPWPFAVALLAAVGLAFQLAVLDPLYHLARTRRGLPTPKETRP